MSKASEIVAQCRSGVTTWLSNGSREVVGSFVGLQPHKLGLAVKTTGGDVLFRCGRKTAEEALAARRRAA